MEHENSKVFHIGQLLSITTHRLVSPVGNHPIDGVYEILNFLTKDDLMTHQLPRALKACGPWILLQKPELADVDATKVNEKNWRQWLDEQVAKFGELHELTPLNEDDWTRINPLEEAGAIVGDDKVLPVIAGDRSDWTHPLPILPLAGLAPCHPLGRLGHVPGALPAPAWLEGGIVTVTQYVAGFAFDSQGQVALVRKRRPVWQAGKLNGIGGHVEHDDLDSWAAMQREFREETSLDIHDWHRFCTLHGHFTPDSKERFVVHFFTVRVKSLKHTQTTTDEEILVVPLRDIPNHKCLPNLAWLIPMALGINSDSADYFAIHEKYVKHETSS